MGARGIISKPSSSGVRALTAYKRALNLAISEALQAPGLTTVLNTSQAMLIEPGPFQTTTDLSGVNHFITWPLQRNLRYRFSGDGILTSGAPGAVSLESAGMAITLGVASNPFLYATTPSGFNRVNAARLSAQTALAQSQPISFDPWEIDCNDLLQLYPLATYLALFTFFNINNTHAAAVQVNAQTTFEAAAVQFQDYKFDIWE